jgi:hypothetical protein
MTKVALTVFRDEKRQHALTVHYYPFSLLAIGLPKWGRGWGDRGIGG